MLLDDDENFPDVSEKAFAEQQRRLAGLPPELREEFLESFLSWLEEFPTEFWSSAMRGLYENPRLLMTLQLLLEKRRDGHE